MQWIHQKNRFYLHWKDQQEGKKFKHFKPDPMETKEVHGSRVRIATKRYYSIFIPNMHTHENQANNFQSCNGKY